MGSYLLTYGPILISLIALVIALIAEGRTRRYQQGELQLRVLKRDIEVRRKLKSVITRAIQLQKHHWDHKRDYSRSWSQSQRDTSKSCLHRLRSVLTELEGGDVHIGIVGRIEKIDSDHDTLCLFESIEDQLERIETELGQINLDLVGLRDSHSRKNQFLDQSDSGG